MPTDCNTLTERCEKVDRNREGSFSSSKFPKEMKKTLDTYSFLLCLSPLSFFRLTSAASRNLAIIRLDHDAVNRDSLRFNALNIIFLHSFLAYTHTYTYSLILTTGDVRLDYVQNYLQWYTGWSADRSLVRPQTSWRRSASITPRSHLDHSLCGDDCGRLFNFFFFFFQRISRVTIVTITQMP